MAAERTILLTSASGNIGKVLVPLLLSHTPTPRLVLPTSNASKLKTAIPAVDQHAAHTTVVEGSLRDPLWFETILRDNHVDTVFLNLTGTDEMFTALNSLNAISRCPSVKHVVYLSIMGDFLSEAGFKYFLREKSYPHVFAKMAVEAKLLHGGYAFDWTVLGPSYFFSNFEMFRGPMLGASLLPGPLSKRGLSVTSLQDIALATQNVVFDASGAWRGKKVQIGSRHPYTGDEILKLWSEALGKQLQTTWADDEGLERFEATFRKMRPGDEGAMWARDLKLLSEFLGRCGLENGEEDNREQVKLLGREAEDLGAWIQKTGAVWLKAASS